MNYFSLENSNRRRLEKQWEKSFFSEISVILENFKASGERDGGRLSREEKEERKKENSSEKCAWQFTESQTIGDVGHRGEPVGEGWVRLDKKCNRQAGYVTYARWNWRESGRVRYGEWKSRLKKVTRSSNTPAWLPRRDNSASIAAGARMNLWFNMRPAALVVYAP